MAPVLVLVLVPVTGGKGDVDCADPGAATRVDHVRPPTDFGRTSSI